MSGRRSKDASSTLACGSSSESKSRRFSRAGTTALQRLMATCWAIGHLSSHSKALPFCHVTLKGQKPLPHGYPAQPKTLGDQLRKKRMDLGLSQRALASQLGVSRTSIENWEGNEVKPARWMMTRIKEFLGLQISQTP